MKIFFKKDINRNVYISQSVDKVVLPGNINNKNPEYLKIDDMFFSGVFIVDLPRVIVNSIFEIILYNEENINFSIFFEKLNNSDVIKEITQNIGLISADLKINSDNKQDYNILETSHSDAKYIRHELQINNENIYNINIYVYIYENSLKNLKNKISKVQNMLNSLGFYSKNLNFRNLDLYKSILPFNQNSPLLSNISKRSLLSKPLSMLYPFISNSIFDENGILFGTNQNNLIIIDRFKKSSYMNSNMLVLGMSGAGKSYFIKLQILRNSILNIKQLVIDPEGEYINICNEVKGEYICLNKNNSINIFDLFYCENYDESLLKEKIQTLILFFELIFKEITDDEKAILEDCLIDCYNEKGITFDNYSIEVLLDENLMSNEIDLKYLPKMEDLYKKLLNNNKCVKLVNILKIYVHGSMNDFNNKNRPNFKNKLVIVDIHKIKDEHLNIYLFLIVEFYWNIIKTNKSVQKIIYIDELWKLIKSNEKVANFMIQIFKTIRKYNGAATAITQDVNDLISFKNDYGKAILSNSYFKLIFKINEENINELSKLIYLTELEKNIFSNITRGDGLLMVDRNNMKINIISSEYEKRILEGEYI